MPNPIGCDHLGDDPAAKTFTKQFTFWLCSFQSIDFEVGYVWVNYCRFASFNSKDMRHKMFRGLLLLGITFFLSSTMHSQAFQDIGVVFPGVEWATVEWGDYDNDGDLDFVMTGEQPNSIAITKIFRKDGATFNDINAGLPGLRLGDATWGDYDNDGDLDIALSGLLSFNYISRIYRNDAGTFTDINAALNGGSYAKLEWLDSDNDGDLDLLLTGGVSLFGEISSTIYRNDNGNFVDSNAGLFGFYDAAIAIGDYDNDGDLDIMLSGNYNYNQSPYFETKLFKNDGGTFTEVYPWPFAHCEYGAAAWADYDNDGDLDLALAGYPGSGNSFLKFYRNFNGTFSETTIAQPSGGSHGSVSWGDYDNDGDPDLMINGLKGNGSFTQVYRNSNGGFAEDIVPYIERVGQGEASWGDYDNDGDLDVVLSGVIMPSGIRNTSVYRNPSSIANNAPSIPTGLTAVSQGANSIRFSWNAGTDNETPSPGLSYRLRIGTSPGGFDVSAPLADTATGWRLIAAPGNIKGTSWTLRNAIPGQTYFASVASVDAGLKGSQYGSNSSVTMVGLQEGQDAIHTILAGPNPTAGRIHISTQFGLKGAGSYHLTNVNGQVLDGFSGKWIGEFDLDLSSLPSGVYWLQLNSKEIKGVSSVQIIKI